MSLFKQYETDRLAERDGLAVVFDDVVLTIARAGGSNQAYKNLLQSRLKKVRRQLDQETLSGEKQEEILAGVYAETIILGWETKVGVNGLFCNAVGNFPVSSASFSKNFSLPLHSNCHR